MNRARPSRWALPLLAAALAALPPTPAAMADEPRIERVEILVLRLPDHEQVGVLRPGDVLDLEVARLRGELAASEKIERVAQRYADKLEEKLETSRRREASLARAVGYLEAERDGLRRSLGRSTRGPRASLPRA